MYLGIVPSNNGRHHDSSACLVDDGEIVCFIEQERISRNKHAVGEFPIKSIEECLRTGSVKINEIEKIGLSRNYNNRRKVIGRLARRSLRSTSIGTGEKLWDAMLLPIKQTVTMTNESLKSLVIEHLNKHFSVSESEIPPVTCINHQLTHAASAFYPSGYDDALVVSLDNYGGHLSGAIFTGYDDVLEEINSFKRFNSLGRFFGDITEFLGFRRSNGEGKVMGLAPYGEKNQHIQEVLEGYISINDKKFNTERLTYRKPKDAIKKLEKELEIEQKYWKDEITQEYKDIAFHTQQLLEDIVTKLISDYVEQVSTKNVCLAGGIALNCKMNKRIRELPAVENLFVQPAANDAGGSIGAALELGANNGTDISEIDHMYFGSNYSDEEITKVLDDLKISYQSVESVPKKAAKLLHEGALIGWFQGSMEGGPRALGNRSILADPRSIESRDKVNKHVKHREEWRPFAPSMLKQEAERLLVGDISDAAYYMIDTYETTSVGKEEIPAVLHPADGTTRPQIVTKDRNRRYYRLLQEFKQRSGVGAVLNTSFNDSGEPIVRTPREAVRDFYSMGLDALIMGNVMIHK
jgi:carbamoyltransferase